jgi:hypothetical protein
LRKIGSRLKLRVDDRQLNQEILVIEMIIFGSSGLCIRNKG